MPACYRRPRVITVCRYAVCPALPSDVRSALSFHLVPRCAALAVAVSTNRRRYGIHHHTKNQQRALFLQPADADKFETFELRIVVIHPPKCVCVLHQSTVVSRGGQCSCLSGRVGQVAARPSDKTTRGFHVHVVAQVIATELSAWAVKSQLDGCLSASASSTSTSSAPAASSAAASTAPAAASSAPASLAGAASSAPASWLLPPPLEERERYSCLVNLL